jgi:coenzyme Q-binding protein COQ10
MPTYRAERRVKHSAEQMFDLVIDVESYPQFVPFSTAARLRNREEIAPGVTRSIAEMEVGYKAIREKFTTRGAFDRPNLKVLVQYVDGPFSRLENRWSFRDVETPDGAPACVVDFFITYEFKSRVLALLLGSMFETIFKRFSAAFEARADEVYGKRHVS